MCLCGSGVQERAEDWVYRLRCPQSGKDQGECLEKMAFQICFSR